MRLDVITLFPDQLKVCVGFGVTGRAVETGLIELECWNPRDYADDRRGTVDDRPFGGGPGMVMKVDPLRRCLDAARADDDPGLVVHLTPQGRPMDQALVGELAARERLILLCGRYEGIDERFIESQVDMEVSIGDYVMSGGELGAAVLIDCMARLQPGALGKDESAVQDSFMAGLLDCPHYTRPEVLDGQHVPSVLLSGDHARIGRWRLKQSLGRTWLRRPDLLASRSLDETERALLKEFIEEFMAEQGGFAEQKKR